MGKDLLVASAETWLRSNAQLHSAGPQGPRKRGRWVTEGMDLAHAYVAVRGWR